MAKNPWMVVAGLLLLSLGCSDDGDAAATIAFDVDSQLDSKTFWDLPFPSDLRLTADGKIDLAGFPNDDKLPLVTDLLTSAADRQGFPVMPVAWFRFTDASTAPALRLTNSVVATSSNPILLVDIDPTSPELGRLFPIVAELLPVDDYTAPALIAVAPRPGIVLRANTTYSFVLQKSLAPTVAVPAAFATLAKGGLPNGRRGADAKILYEPLWPALAMIAVEPASVLVATVFTTGDQVATMGRRSLSVLNKHPVQIDNLALAAIDNGSGLGAHEGFCHLTASVTMPQFQTGTPPFNSAGKILLDADNVPIKQGEQVVPLHITIPRATMPTTGWPLFHYFHGSGGLAVDLVDLGAQQVRGGDWEAGKGPGWVVAHSKIAAAAAALPLNPERLPGATDYQYLNINNLPAFPFTFQQGVIEQRLLLDALLKLRIPAAMLASCTGVNLPVGSTEYFFDGDRLAAGGHSMGGMYTNMIGAVEPRYKGFTPFGAGGFWPLMILNTAIFPDAGSLLAGVLRVDAETFTFVHPALALLGMGWEIAEPGASMARIARRPVDGPPRHVYQPIGANDKYFPNPIFDAAALAYGNNLAGATVWPQTAEALALDGLNVAEIYPVTGNRSQLGATTTSVVVQYQGDGIADPHNIFIQLPAVKYQYRCFLETLFRDGIPTVFAPKAIDAACE